MRCEGGVAPGFSRSPESSHPLKLAGLAGVVKTAVGSRSRIKPLLEMHLEALEHLFFYVFDVGEQVPTSDIAVFTGALKLQNEFFR